MKAKEEKYKCPCCKSENIVDNSKRESNGVMGSGYRSWIVFECWLCNDCGVLFKKVNRNEKEI